MLVSLKVYEKRTDWLRNVASARGVDCVIVMVDEGYNWESCYYLSGFRGTSAALLVTGKASVLVADARYTQQAKQQSPYEVVDRQNASMLDTLAQWVKKLGAGTVAVEAERVSHRTWEDFSARTDARITDGSGLVPSLRRTKDEHEISIIREAARIGAAAFLEALGSVHAGMTEREFADTLEYRLKLDGAEGGWGGLPFVVASGARSALPHGTATDRKFLQGDWVTVDFGARYGGYVCDITRNFAIGRVSPWAEEINDVLCSAQAAAVACVKAGVAARTVDAAAREVIERAGWGCEFSHGLGHGIGLEVHEAPRVSMRSDDVLQCGDVITIEPGIYVNGRGGLRLEDNYAIWHGGAAEHLTPQLANHIFCV